MKVQLYFLMLFNVANMSADDRILGRVSGAHLVPTENRISLFSAIQETGMRFVHKDKHAIQKGKEIILVFGFTSCLGVCPATMKVLEKAISSKEFTENTQVLFVSVDPREDTPQKVTRFLSQYKISSIGLLGTKKATADFYGKFIQGRAGVLFSPAQHSSLLYVIGPDGYLKGHVSTEIPLAQVKRALTSLR